MQTAIEAEPIEEVKDIELPVRYDVTDAAIFQIRQKYSDLTIIDNASYEAVRLAIADVRGRRTAVEKRRKELKARALDYGRRVDAEAKRITGLLEPIEESLKATKQAEDDKRESAKHEEERKDRERIAGIKAMIETIKAKMPTVPKSSDELVEILFDLDTTIIGIEFQEFSGEAETARLDAVEKINQAIAVRIRWEEEEKTRQEELARLEAIREENHKAEAERKAKEAAAEAIRKAEQEKLDAERRTLEAERARLEEQKRSEEEKIKLIAEARFKELKAINVHYSFGDLGTMPESQYKAMYDQYKADWDREQEASRIEAEAKAKREREEFERIAAEKAEREAREKLEKEAAEKKAKAEAAEAERVRKEALMPDREKLLSFAAYLENELPVTLMPLTESESGDLIRFAALNQIFEVVKFIKAKVEELL